ncbi:MAG: metallophosphoesterase, partial [Pseudomonadota bacterium]
DYQQFVAALRDAGLVNRRGKWLGGESHLVQIGDIPDRGPDSDRVIRLMKSLERQAAEAGGEVHALIGNHETMVMRGDLRYVHPGEYEALRDKYSERRQKAYFDKYVAWIKRSTPEEEWPTFDRGYFLAWKDEYPVGYTEHRQAWAADGDFGAWVREHDTVVRINDALFVHGGINLDGPLQTIDEINAAVRAELSDARASEDDSIINASDGPLWYRGLAVMAETEENLLKLKAMLDFYGVQRIVVAHTPLMGAIVPRFGGRVLLADVGLSEHYGSERASLQIENGIYSALVNGQAIPLPSPEDPPEATLAYFEAIKPLVRRPSKVDKYVTRAFRPDTGQ